jgi:predicted O-linked N-acetylglucosamine transferase (SPINDLY family)
MLLKWMKKSGVTQPVLSPKKTGKLKLLILSEHFTSNHAMYRCFSPSLAQLRSKFYTTLVATTGSYDDTSKSLFDELIDFDRTDPIKKIIGKIIKAQADILYYPSLGMHSWTIMASQLRLAPIQMMTLGHPATSHSVFMDYTLIEEFSLGDPQCFSETVVVKNEGAKYCPYDDKEPPAPVIRENPDIIKIAIPATMYKLNSNFLHVCNNIRNRVKRRVEFHFFPNRIGIMLDFARQMIWKSLPDSTIYPSMSYEDYMTNLGSCDIHFSTFPFGLVNGVVDSALLGLPIVALDGPEVHSHADVGFQKRLGLPEWLSAQNEEEFEEAAIRIISDDALRVQISNAIIAADPYKLFFSNDQTKTDYFANLADWIYRNHEALQADGRKIWNEEDFIDGGDVQPVLANSTS